MAQRYKKQSAFLGSLRNLFVTLILCKKITFIYLYLGKDKINMKNDLLRWLRHYISPAFFVMLTASFVLWYIAKLGYSYTTDLDVNVKIGSAKFEVNCVIEGVGTNLFGYRLYKGGKVSIPLSELKYQRSMEGEDFGSIIIEPQSLQNALSVRYSDIKVVSIGSIPPLSIGRDEEQKLIK